MYLYRRFGTFSAHTRCVGGVGPLLVGVLLLGAPLRLDAQTTTKQPDLSDLSLEQLMSIEVQSVFGASKFLQKITEAPSPVTIITAEEIKRYGYRTLGDALRSVRGFFVADDRAYAFIGIRGFQQPGDYNTHVLILIDGHRANDNVYDQASIDEVSPVVMDDVERIEVIRGPSSSLYGSNAFFGVVNLITKRGEQAKGVAATVELGSYGRQAGRVSWGRRFGSDVDIMVSGTFADSDGNSQLYFPELDDPTTNFGVAENVDRSWRRNVFANVEIGPFTIHGAFNARRKWIPTGAYGYVFNDQNNTLEDRWGFVDVAYNHVWTSGLNLHTRGFVDAYTYLGSGAVPAGDGEPGNVVINHDEGVGRWAGGEVQLSGTWRRRHRLTAGMEYRANVRQRQLNYDVDPRFTYLDDRRSSSTYGLYVQDEIRINKYLIANVGVRHDEYSQFEDPTKPRLGLIVNPTPTSTIKILYGGAFRAPAVYEAFYSYGIGLEGVLPYLPNPDLRPEEIQTAEAVWEQYLGRHYRASAGAFRYRIDNLISQVFDPVQGGVIYDNTDSITASGVEFEIEGKWTKGIQARASYAYQHSRDVQTGEPLTNSPAHVAQTLFSAPLFTPNVVLGLTAQAVSSRTTKWGGSTGAYVLASANLTTPLVGRHLELRFTVNNLLDHRYLDPAAEELPQEAVPQNGRTAYARVTWRF